jgi:hypothetical protein
MEQHSADWESALLALSVWPYLGSSLGCYHAEAFALFLNYALTTDLVVAVLRS